MNSITKEIAAPKGQLRSAIPCWWMSVDMTGMRGPPMSAGVTKALIASTKTSSEPEIIPGSESGSVISRKMRVAPAPRFRAAS